MGTGRRVASPTGTCLQAPRVASMPSPRYGGHAVSCGPRCRAVAVAEPLLLRLAGSRNPNLASRGTKQEYEEQQTQQVQALLERFDAAVYDDFGCRARQAANDAGATQEPGADAGGERRAVRMRPDRQVVRPLEVVHRSSLACRWACGDG